MKIIIVGCGKVGFTLVEQLNNEGHDITVIDRDGAKLRALTDSLDAVSYTHLDVYKRQASYRPV